MFVLKSIVVGLASIASTVLAAPSTCPAVKRDVSGIVSDFASLTTVVGWNLGNITAYQGGLDGNILVPLVTASNLVDTLLNQTTLDVAAHEAFSTADSTTLLAKTTALVSLLGDTLNALLTKQPLFRAANIHGIVLNSIVAHSTEEDLMYDQLILKAPAAQKASFQALRDNLLGLYNTVVAAYSAA
ncbi:hypothetical protein BGZ60DRAFT_431588 [Tricladium varicosporioides]|nr:hypothetical protein BGZ60DRAFT_431588 [Hymenoscyphus varicosporioides]